MFSQGLTVIKFFTFDCYVLVLNNILSIIIFYFYDVMLNNLGLFYVEIDVFSYL